MAIRFFESVKLFISGIGGPQLEWQPKDKREEEARNKGREESAQQEIQRGIKQGVKEKAPQQVVSNNQLPSVSATKGADVAAVVERPAQGPESRVAGEQQNVRKESGPQARPENPRTAAFTEAKEAARGLRGLTSGEGTKPATPQAALPNTGPQPTVQQPAVAQAPILPRGQPPRAQPPKDAGQTKGEGNKSGQPDQMAANQVVAREGLPQGVPVAVAPPPTAGVQSKGGGEKTEQPSKKVADNKGETELAKSHGPHSADGTGKSDKLGLAGGALGDATTSSDNEIIGYVVFNSDPNDKETEARIDSLGLKSVEKIVKMIITNPNWTPVTAMPLDDRVVFLDRAKELSWIFFRNARVPGCVYGANMVVA